MGRCKICETARGTIKVKFSDARLGLGANRFKMVHRVCKKCWFDICDDYDKPHDSKELIMTVRSERPYIEGNDVLEWITKNYVEESDEIIVIKRLTEIQ